MYSFRYPGMSIGLILLGTFLFIGHHAILDQPPQSMHKWRQTDSASFAWNYYTASPNLFKPQFHNLYNEQKAAAEFPILYWIVGMLYRLFQPHHAWFRGLQLLIVFSGFWALFKLANLYLADHLWSMIYMLLLAGSPLLHFYANGFIPDSPVFALCCWGAYAFFFHLQQHAFSSLTWAILAFCLAAMMKASSVGCLGVAGILLLYEAKQSSHLWLRQRTTWTKVGLLLGAMGLILLWYIYATWYSTGFERGHFGHIIKAFGLLAKEQRLEIWHYLSQFHLPFFYSPLCGTLILFISIVPLLAISKSDKKLWIASAFLLLSMLVYGYYFYWLMGIHDYYLLAFLPLIALALLHGLVVLQRLWPRLWQSPWLKCLLVAVCIFGLYRAKTELRIRYFGRTMNYKEQPAFYESGLQDFLLKAGVGPQNTVVSVPDFSPNNTLYLLNRRGWTNANFGLTQPHKMDQWIGQGLADFLIVADSSLLRSPEWQAYMRSPNGEYKGIFVFDLREISRE
ncbi:MAG: glycosyltransferase family 39 protein [Bacteroidota bacterium]